MKIGIDARPLTLTNRTGIATYIANVLEYIHETDDENEYYLYARGEILADFITKPNWHRCVYPGGLSSLWIQYRLPRILRKDGISVFWGGSHVLPLGDRSIYKILTLHDLSLYKFPHTGSRSNALMLRLTLPFSVRQADQILCISASTMKDVNERWPMTKGRTHVTYMGTSAGTIAPDRVIPILEKWNLMDNYFLYLGTLEPRKNIQTIVKAYNAYRKAGNPGYPLVLAGGLGWKYEGILAEINASPYHADILQTGYISSEEKTCLYQNAFCFLFPSLYEGFGIPVIEAMHYGTPVITCDNSSLPEVGGQAAWYLSNPADYNELSHLMEKIVALPEKEREWMRLASMEQSRKFSWETCARQTLEHITQK